MQILHVGLAWTNGPEQITDRPHGVGVWQVNHFHDPVLIDTGSGPRRYDGQTGCIFAPDDRQWYQAAGPSFKDDWLTVRGSIERWCADYQLPIGHPFPLGGITTIAWCWQTLGREWRERPLFTEEAQGDLLRMLLRELARSRLTVGESGEDRHRQALLALRERIRRSCQEVWGLERMAQEVGLSRSRLSLWYRRLCGDTPQRDLTAFRMQRACELLLDSSLSVAAVGQACGYDDPLYFCRIYRRHFGRPPSRAR